MARTVLGLDAKLYRNTGTWGSPTWELIDNVKDVSLAIEKSEADVSTRASTWALAKGALKSATIEWQMVYDPTDADWTAIKTAFLAGTAIELAVMDGDITVAANEGLHADFEVLKWTHQQNLEEVLMTEISVKPTRTANVPEWKVISA